MLKSKYQLLAIDVDGTLLGPDHAISPATSTALLAAIDAGWVVCVCTGRNYTEARAYLRQLESKGPGVFASGAIAQDVVTGKTLFRYEIEPRQVTETIRLYRSSGHGVLVLTDPSVNGWEYAYLPGEREHPRLTEWLANTPTLVQRFETEPPWQGVLRIGVIGGTEDMRVVHQQIAQQFGRQVYHHTIRVPNHNMIVHETFAPDANKWTAVTRVAKEMGIREEQIIAIGDDMNDIPMLRGAGLGVAMGNASNATLRAADIVIPPNSQDGLAKFIRRLLSGKVLI